MFSSLGASPAFFLLLHFPRSYSSSYSSSNDDFRFLSTVNQYQNKYQSSVCQGSQSQVFFKSKLWSQTNLLGSDNPPPRDLCRAPRFFNQAQASSPLPVVASWSMVDRLLGSLMDISSYAFDGLHWSLSRLHKKTQR